MTEGISNYDKQSLSKEEILAGKHREFIGGMWEQMGSLQFDFLIAQGLEPSHTLLDIGCGSLRGGLHFIRHLDRGNYYGVDGNASLIDAARYELDQANLNEKAPTLKVDDSFNFETFERTFDYMVSISVFTHLPHNSIVRCLKKAGQVLASDGVYYATYFEAPETAFLEPLTHSPGGVVTYYEKNPFHYSQKEVAMMAELAGLRVEIIGEWAHPRDQRMAAFRR